jgi:hypothetical protein
MSMATVVIKEGQHDLQLEHVEPLEYAIDKDVEGTQLVCGNDVVMSDSLKTINGVSTEVLLDICVESAN